MLLRNALRWRSHVRRDSSVSVFYCYRCGTVSSCHHASFLYMQTLSAIELLWCSLTCDSSLRWVRLIVFSDCRDWVCSVPWAGEHCRFCVGAAGLNLLNSGEKTSSGGKIRRENFSLLCPASFCYGEEQAADVLAEILSQNNFLGTSIEEDRFMHSWQRGNACCRIPGPKESLSVVHRMQQQAMLSQHYILRSLQLEPEPIKVWSYVFSKLFNDSISILRSISLIVVLVFINRASLIHDQRCSRDLKQESQILRTETWNCRRSKSFFSKEISSQTVASPTGPIRDDTERDSQE